MKLARDSTNQWSANRAGAVAMESSWTAAHVFLLLLAGSLLAPPALVLADAAPTPASTEDTTAATSVASTTTNFVLTEEPLMIQTFKNPQCPLNQLQAASKTRRCGLKELNPVKGRGVVFWTPKTCGSKCQCRATKEIRREKRTIVNNKTVIEYRRFRVFECV